MTVTIRLRVDGPLVIDGPVRIVDAAGNEFPLPSHKPLVALCRCGQSATKPFCDGAHKRCGFVSAETPPDPGPASPGAASSNAASSSPQDSPAG